MSDPEGEEWYAQVTAERGPRGLRFDPHWRAASEPTKAALQDLADHLEAREATLAPRRRDRKEVDRRKFRLAVEAIGINLLLAEHLAPGRRVEYPRDASTLRQKDPKRPLVYGKPFKDAIDLLAHPAIGFITATLGFKPSSGPGRLSAMRPKPAFFEFLADAAFSLEAIVRDDAAEVLVLKASAGDDDHATEQSFEETPATRRMRKEVVRINAMLKRADIALLPSHSGGTRYGEGKDDRPVDPTRRTVRRIFSNGCWENGGRLYGAFWETLPRSERDRIRLNGEAVVNVDYRQLYLRIAYAKAGALPPEGDLYDIRGDGRNRDGWKRLVNALFMAKGPLRNWPRDLPKLFDAGARWVDHVAAVKAKHPMIADQFGNGAGARFAFVESEMLIEVLLALDRRGIPALPLHDAVLVAEHHAETARDQMQAVAERRLGVDIGNMVAVQ